jgi:transcriptional regulator with XRE-family HTH domain
MCAKHCNDANKYSAPLNAEFQKLLATLAGLTRSRKEMAVEVGVTPQTVGAWMRDARACTLESLAKMRSAAIRLRRRFPGKGGSHE